MSFTFTSQQIADIQAELAFIDFLLSQDPDASGPYVDAYNMVFQMITDIDPVTGEQTPKAGIDTNIERGAWVFIRGVSHVNANDTDNDFNNFIRAYSKIQYETRFGVEATDAQVQNASNAIARAILEDIVSSGVLPDINDIAENDAESAATEMFTQAEIAGWAGNPMLIPVGHISSFQTNILHQNGEGDPSDTYDLLAVAYSMMKAADEIGISATFANVWDVAFDVYATTNNTSGWIDYLETIWNDQNISTVISQSEAMLQNAYGGRISLDDLTGYFSFWDDIHLGNAGNNLMDEGDWADDDIIHAGAGNDTIVGSEGDDLIDGGEGNDWVDYSDFDDDIEVNLPENESQTGFSFLGDTDYLYNIENIKTGGGDDTLIGGEDTRVLDAGAGDDVLEIIGNAAEATLKGGAGEDTLKGGNGSIVYGDEGADTFIIGQQYLIADASGEDRLQSAGGWTLTGGIRWAGSETPWATGIDGTKYGINTAGELVVQGTVGKETYVANFNNTLDGPYTAGIGIGELSLEFYRLLESPNGWGLFGTFEALMGYALKFLTGESGFGTVDPLVLDLDGDGIELMARSSVSPFFDVDGDGFAEQMGWVQGDDGFLVRDLNGNGSIDDVGEMFGDGDTSGFAALSEAKQYNGRGWDAEGVVAKKAQKIAKCGTIAERYINGLRGKNDAFSCVFAQKMHDSDAEFAISET